MSEMAAPTARTVSPQAVQRRERARRRRAILKGSRSRST